MYAATLPLSQYAYSYKRTVTINRLIIDKGSLFNTNYYMKLCPFGIMGLSGVKKCRKIEYFPTADHSTLLGPTGHRHVPHVIRT